MANGGEGDVTLAILVPIYGHTSLVMEALLSTLTQKVDGDHHTICVVDGDPDCGLARLLTSFCAIRNNKCSAYWRRNGGLSAARNAAIAIALARFPNLTAVFFLDADNRLAPGALSKAHRRIIRGEGDVIYPNLTDFGLRGAQDTSGRFSFAALLRGNYIEAGSLVSVRVLRSGLRFDESLREGYEDWAFWLSAAGSGFKFVHEPTLGLLYRRRPESMLANTRRRSPYLRNAIESTHSELYDNAVRRRIVADDEPTYALINVDADVVRFSTDLQSMTEHIDIPACGRQIHLHAAAPNWTYVPRWFVFIGSDTVKVLRDIGLLPGLVWRLTTSGPHAICRMIPRSGTSFTLAVENICDAHVVTISCALLCACLRGSGDLPLPQTAFAMYLPETLSGKSPSTELAARDIVSTWAAMPLAATAAIRWSERAPVAPRLPVDAEENVFPAPFDGHRHIGFLQQSKDDLKSVQHLATLLADAGLTPHLFSRDSIDMETLRHFSTTTLLEEADQPVISQDVPDGAYFGAPLNRGDQRLIAALRWLDVLILSDAADILPLLGDLRVGRTMIVITWAGPSITSVGKFCRDCDSPYRLSGYEHAVDAFFVDRSGAILLTALGVPRAKIIARETPAALVDLLELRLKSVPNPGVRENDAT